MDKNNVCDRSVYKSVQLFRIEGSTKHGENRCKYLYGEENISECIELFLAYCPDFRKPKNYTKNDTLDYSKIPDYDHYTTGKRVNNNLIHLKRNSPGYCNLCKRTHDKENAYTIFSKGEWRFHCFRNQ